MNGPQPATVSCYAGYKGDQEPRNFTIADEHHTVAHIEKRWREPEADYFDIRTDRGARYRLRQDRTTGDWTARVCSQC